MDFTPVHLDRVLSSVEKRILPLEAEGGDNDYLRLNLNPVKASL